MFYAALAARACILGSNSSNFQIHMITDADGEKHWRLLSATVE